MSSEEVKKQFGCPQGVYESDFKMIKIILVMFRINPTHAFGHSKSILMV